MSDGVPAAPTCVFQRQTSKCVFGRPASPTRESTARHFWLMPHLVAEAELTCPTLHGATPPALSGISVAEVRFPHK